MARQIVATDDQQFGARAGLVGNRRGEGLAGFGAGLARAARDARAPHPCPGPGQEVGFDLALLLSAPSGRHVALQNLDVQLAVKQQRTGAERPQERQTGRSRPGYFATRAAAP